MQSEKKMVRTKFVPQEKPRFKVDLLPNSQHYKICKHETIYGGKNYDITSKSVSIKSMILHQN